MGQTVSCRLPSGGILSKTIWSWEVERGKWLLRKKLKIKVKGEKIIKGKEKNDEKRR